MSHLISSQHDLNGRISRCFENLKKLGANNITKGNVASRLETLRRNWAKYESQHDQLLALAASDLAFASNDYFKDRDLSPAFMEEVFNTQEALLMDKLADITKMELIATRTLERLASDERTAESHAAAVRPSASLPRIPLPTFAGKHKDWPSFQGLFRSLVVRDTTLTDAERLHYLRGALTGDAELLLRNMPESEENFEVAWQLLQDRYDNQRLMVKAQMNTIFGLPTITRESGPELKRLFYTVCDSVKALEAMKRPYDASGDWLIHLIVERIDPQSRRDWETAIGKTKLPPTFAELQGFLEGRVNTLEALEEQCKRPENRTSKPGATQKSTKVHQVSQSKRASEPCSLCKANHFILYCRSYKSKTIAERRAALQAANLCYNCLGKHQVKDCHSDRRCQQCNGKHHTTIHESSAIASDTQEVTVNTSTCLSNPLPVVLLATARVRLLQPDGGSRIVRALIDQGSEVSILTEALAQQLRLRRRPSNIRLVGVGSKASERIRGQVQLEFTAHFNATKRHVVAALVLPRITSYQPRIDRCTRVWSHLQDLTLADPNFDSDGPIDLLLGADAFALILLDGIAKGRHGEPMAQRTALGWIVSGPATPDTSNEMVGGRSRSVLQCSSDEELLPLVRRFWEQEEFPVSDAYTPEEQICEDHYRTTHQRLPSGRYLVRLPLRDTLDLGESRHGARRMLLRMENKFAKEPVFAQTYQEFMSEYLQLNHMSRARVQLPGPSYYLPHHGVLKESSTTTKLRVVFNGSYATTTGHSLNDALLVGPNLLPSLQQLLLRWRVHRICLTADIEKMYRQILLHPDDRRYQLVLWRANKDSEISDYELNTVTYGLNCAPYLAIRTLRQLASDEQQRFPRAAAILQRDVYMDDVVTGADSIEEATDLQSELRQLCKAGGFNLRKWASNQPALMEKLPAGDAIPVCKWQAGETYTALGVHWSLVDDCFRVQVQPHAADSGITRRRVLSAIAKIFDPLGLVAPVTVNAKIFMQSLWLLNLDWDTPLPPTEAGYWMQFLDELPELNRIAVPRWLGVQQTPQFRELHGFADASERAYAAVVYLRVGDNDGLTRTHLIMAKTKVAPLKRISLPRLELCAAALLTKLMALTCASLDLSGTAVHLWSNSTITLAWIQGHPSRWKTYVANRVSEIQRTLPEAQWHHVSSQDNPADCASRGLPPSQLPDFALWWTGPVWLTTPGGWDNKNQPTLPLTDLEARTTCTLTSGENATGNPLLYHYSNITSLLRTTAWCLRWLPRRDSLTLGCRLVPTEVEAARVRWLRLVQHQEFATDIQQLEGGRPLPNRSRLRRLNPYLDEQGLLRVGGRLRHAALSLDAQHQILLPRDSRLTELLVDEAHQRTLHGGTQLTLATMRQKYWIPQGRQRIKAILHRCVTCIRWRATTGQQLMGDLPAARVTPARPFLHVGVDYAGPLTLLRTRGRGQRTHKGYIALFVCLSTRAVHLELVSDYSTEAFLAALRRFTSRRGLCAVIQSDQGTTFVGAARELRDMLAHLDSGRDAIHSALLKDGIEWRFNPPAAPHFGGLWEAAVKSTKYHLRRVIGEQHLTFEEMTTLLHQIEACLNSRPLQAMSDDPGDLTTLTPGHFLIGEALLSLPDPPIDDVPASRLSRWHLLQHMRLQFWKRWSAEYLQSLQARNKWTHQRPQPRIGDLCIVKSELTSPARWPLARVTKLHTGPDGLTRVVTIKTARSELIRPICKLVFIPFTQTTSPLQCNDPTVH